MVTILPVTTKKQRKQFVEFPLKLLKKLQGLMKVLNQIGLKNLKAGE